MALIKKYIRDEQGISKRQITDTECTYKTGYLNGEKLLILSTCGSEDRKEKGKSSQVIHMNLESAKELMKILKKEFNIS